MKAFLLSAGLGTRLRPLTNEIPKCLLPVGGKPLLEIWLDLLDRHGVDEVLVNTHWYAEKVVNFLEGEKVRKEEDKKEQRTEVRDQMSGRDRGRRAEVRCHPSSPSATPWQGGQMSEEQGQGTEIRRFRRLTQII